jgi:hypothetical protein
MKALMMTTIRSATLVALLSCCVAGTASATIVKSQYSGTGVCGAFSYDSAMSSSNCSASARTCDFVFTSLAHSFYEKTASSCLQNGSNQPFRITMFYGTSTAAATFTLTATTGTAQSVLVLTYASNSYCSGYGSLPTSLDWSQFRSMTLHVISLGTTTYPLNSLAATSILSACACTVPKISPVVFFPPEPIVVCPPQPIVVCPPQPIVVCPPQPCTVVVRQPLLARLREWRPLRRVRCG